VQPAPMLMVVPQRVRPEFLIGIVIVAARV
jgi:hypothetical protein